MFAAIVAAGGDPQWVAEGMRVSFFPIVFKAMARRKHDDWERCKTQALLPAMAAGAKIRFSDFKNPWQLDECENDEPTSDAIAAARERLKKIKQHGK